MLLGRANGVGQLHPEVRSEPSHASRARVNALPAAGLARRSHWRASAATRRLHSSGQLREGIYVAGGHAAATTHAAAVQ